MSNENNQNSIWEKILGLETCRKSQKIIFCEQNDAQFLMAQLVVVFCLFICPRIYLILYSYLGNLTTHITITFYEDHHENCTLYDNYNVTVPDLDENQNLRYKISIAATSLRTNQIYIRVYILWINLIFQVGQVF